MLLHTFSSEQKSAFLRLVRDLATADKSLHTGERDIIREVCGAMGISVLSVSTGTEDTPLETIFDSNESRAMVMIELARLSVVDKVFSFGENELLNSVRRKFGFARKDLDDFLRLAEVYNLLRQGIRALAAGCGAPPNNP